MKKIFCFLIVLCMIFSLSIVFSSADKPVKVTINGVNCEYDVPPTNINGRILVPVRAIFEALGAEVTWDKDTKTAIGKKGNTEVILKVDSKKATLNGEQIELDVPATIIDNRVLAPARFVAESMGADVNWDSDNNTVAIITKENENSTIHEDTEKSITLGNKSGNYTNGGWVNHANDYEYFVSSEYWDAYDLYQATYNRSHFVRLVEEVDAFPQISIINEDIYYLSSDSNWNSYIFKINKDGTNMQKLSKNNVKSMVVDSTGIYYINADDENKLYWVALDGSDSKKLVDENIDEINFNSEHLFFTVHKEEFDFGKFMTKNAGIIYKVDRNGENKEKLSDDLAFDINITDDYVYYINKTDNMKIYRINLSHFKNEKLMEDTASDLNVCENKIYYANTSDPITIASEYESFTGGRLYSSNLDGNNKEKLADSLTSNIVVGEEGIYFYEYHDDGSKNYDLRRKYDFNTKTLQYVISLSFSEKE